MNPASGPYTPPPVLTGERVVLRPFTAADAPAMIRILADPEVRRFTGAEHVDLPAERLRAWYGGRAGHTDRLDLAIVDRVTGAVVGESVLLDLDGHNRGCEFRILIGPDGRDRGLGGESVRLTVDHGFRRLGLHRVTLYVFTFNARALRTYEKAGFRAEGVERERLWARGAWHDAVRMSLLDREWAALAGPATGDAPVGTPAGPGADHS